MGSLEGIVFDVQRFCTHDGPGIRTVVFLKGCPLRCAWCQNPESLSPNIEIAYVADRCRGSADCVAVCPQAAITGDGERLDRSRCDLCGRCIDACPFGAFEQVGRRVSAEKLVAEVLRDQPFFQASGGGVTLSGGEPTMQLAFVGAIVDLCREAGVGVGMQTCGAFRWEVVAPRLRQLDFIHFDLKLVDDEAHRQHAGASNRTILDNARKLVGVDVAVHFRMPIVAGYTDTDANLAAVAALLREIGVRKIHLLRYHAMGESKLPRLGFPIPSLGLDADARSGEKLARAADFLRAQALEVTT